MTNLDPELRAVLQAAARVVEEGLELNPMAKLSHEALYELRDAVRTAGLSANSEPVEERSWNRDSRNGLRRETCTPNLWAQLPYRRTIGAWERRL